MSRTTGAEPVVTDDRDHTLARISAMASAIPDRVVEPIWWKVRNTVESDGTDPNRSGCRRRCSMSATALPTTGQHQGRVHEDLPAVVDGEPLTGQRDPGRRVNHRAPIGRQRTQERAGRRGPPRPSRRVQQSRGTRCYRSLWKCPPVAGIAVVSTTTVKQHWCSLLVCPVVVGGSLSRIGGCPTWSRSEC